MNAPIPAAPQIQQRSRGELRIGVAADDRLRDLFQDGALRGRLPRPAPGAGLEAVVINTAGGMTGGDRFAVAVDIDGDARATVVGQACEKIYRSAGGTARLDVDLKVAAGGALRWLPQPAIVFDGADFERRLEIELETGASLFALEATVLGRGAMGETVDTLRLRERWSVRIDGELAWVSAGRLNLPDDPVGARSALGAATAYATIVKVGTDPDADVAAFRALDGALRGAFGASRLGGCAVANLISSDPRHLLEDLARITEALTETAVPRVWHC